MQQTNLLLQKLIGVKSLNMWAVYLLNGKCLKLKKYVLFLIYYSYLKYMYISIVNWGAVLKERVWQGAVTSATLLSQQPHCIPVTRHWAPDCVTPGVSPSGGIICADQDWWRINNHGRVSCQYKNKCIILDLLTFWYQRTNNVIFHLLICLIAQD